MKAIGTIDRSMKMRDALCAAYGVKLRGKSPYVGGIDIVFVEDNLSAVCHCGDGKLWHRVECHRCR